MDGAKTSGSTAVGTDRAGTAAARSIKCFATRPRPRPRALPRSVALPMRVIGWPKALGLRVGEPPPSRNQALPASKEPTASRVSTLANAIRSQARQTDPSLTRKQVLGTIMVAVRQSDAGIKKIGDCRGAEANKKHSRRNDRPAGVSSGGMLRRGYRIPRQRGRRLHLQPVQDHTDLAESPILLQRRRCYSGQQVAPRACLWFARADQRPASQAFPDEGANNPAMRPGRRTRGMAHCRLSYAAS